jgi:hypothetical protein
MDAALLASMTLDGSIFIDDGELVLVGCDFDVLDWNNADDSEESAGWFPALRTATCVVVEDIAGDSHLHFVGRTMAVQLSTGEAGTSFRETFVDHWVKRRHREIILCTCRYKVMFEEKRSKSEGSLGTPQPFEVG